MARPGVGLQYAVIGLKGVAENVDKTCRKRPIRRATVAKMR